MNAKRGSISLSINMIVVVVLAFVMLGLMLGLGQKIIGGAEKTAGQVQEQTRQQIVNELTQSDQPLYFNQREFDVPFGKRSTLSFGIKNIDPTDANLKVEIYYVNGANDVKMASKKIADAAQGGAFFWTESPQKYGAGEGKVFDVQYYAPKTKDTYMFKIKLVQDAASGAPQPLTPVISEQIIYINVI